MTQREEDVTGREQEVEGAVATMGAFFTAFMTGDFRALERPEKFPQVSAFLQKIPGTDARARTPVQRLVIRFASILKRAATALSGGVEAEPRAPDEPGM